MWFPYSSRRRIATRGERFGDASLNISFRNVSVVPFNLRIQSINFSMKQLIQTSIGIPAGLLGGYLVEIPFLGRKRVLVIFVGEYFAMSFVLILFNHHLPCSSQRHCPPG